MAVSEYTREHKEHSMTTATKKAPAKRNVDKAQAKASKQAKEMIQEAKAKVKEATANGPHPEWINEKAADCSDEDWSTGCKVREMRDLGMSWLKIGDEMGFSAGKTGAGQARRAYKKAFGALPETPRSTASLNGGSKRSRAKAESAKGNAAEKLAGMHDAEVEEYLTNKKITYTISLSTTTDDIHSENECRVGRHPKVMTGKKGRYVTFNEPDAGSRSIYLQAIHTVSG